MYNWMKRSKRALTLILAVLMVFTAFPAAAMAYGTEEPSAPAEIVDLTQNLYADNIVPEEEVAEILAEIEATETAEAEIGVLSTPVDIVEWHWGFGGTTVAADDALVEGSIERQVRPTGGVQAATAAHLQFLVGGTARNLTGAQRGINVRNATSGGDGGLNGQAGNAWWQTRISTEDLSDINVSWRMRSSAAGPQNFQLQYRIGAGGTWVPVDTQITIPSGQFLSAAGSLFDKDLPSAAEDVPVLYLRWLLMTETSASGATIAAGGNHQIASILVTGDDGGTPVDIVEWNWGFGGATVAADDALVEGSIERQVRPTGGVQAPTAARLQFLVGGAVRNLTGAQRGVNVRNATSGGDGGLDGQAGNAWWQTRISTEDLIDINVSWRMRSSAAGPQNFQLQYRIGAGGTWVPVDTQITIPSAQFLSAAGSLFDKDLPSAAENVPVLYLRWLLTSETSASGATIAAGGNHQIASILVTGTPDTSGPLTVEQARGIVAGEDVTVRGVVTASYRPGAAGNGIFLQSPTGTTSTSGILVRVLDRDGAGDLAALTALVGQEITVTGVRNGSQPANGFQGVENVTVAAFATIESHGVAPVQPQPVPVTLAQLASGGFRSMLVSITDSVTLTNTFTGATTDPNRQLVETVGGVQAIVWQDPLGNNVPGTFAAGDEVTINRAIVHWWSGRNEVQLRMINPTTDITLVPPTGPVPTVQAAWVVTNNASLPGTPAANRTVELAPTAGIQTAPRLAFHAYDGGLHVQRRLGWWQEGVNVHNAANDGNGGLHEGWLVNDAWWQTTIDTTGLADLTVDFRLRSHGNGPRDWQLQYSTGGAWHNVGDPIVLGLAAGANTLAEPLISRRLPVTAEDEPILHLRWLMTSNTATNGGAVAFNGAHQINDITIRSEVPSISVGTQTGTLIAGTPGDATFAVTTTRIPDAAPITLETAIPGVSLEIPAVITGGAATITIQTTDAAPEGTHTLTLLIAGHRQTFQLEIEAPPGRARDVIAAWEFGSSAAVNAARVDNNTAIPANGGILAPDPRLQFIDGSTPRELSGGVDAISAGTGLNGREHTVWWETRIDTLHYTNIQVAFAMRSSAGGPRDFQLQYRAASGDLWQDVGGLIGIPNAGNITDSANQFVRTLPSSAESATLYLRWIMASNTATNGNPVGGTGTHHINHIVITGADPDVAIYSSPASGTVFPAEGGSVTLSTTDPNATIVYSLNGRDWAEAVAPGASVDVLVTFPNSRNAAIRAFLRPPVGEPTRTVTFTYSRPPEMSIAEANAMSLGDFVVVEGIATRITGATHNESLNLWIQDDSGDPHSGIIVRSRTISLEGYIGYRVRVAGERTVFRGLNQIDIGFGSGSSLAGGSGSLTRHGTAVPPTVPVDWTGDLRAPGYRFMRISLENVEFLAGEDSQMTPRPPVGLGILVCPDGTRIEVQICDEYSPLQPDDLVSGAWINVDFAYVGWNDMRGAVQLLEARISAGTEPAVRHIAATPQSGAVIPLNGVVRLETETVGAIIEYSVNGVPMPPSTANYVEVTIDAFNQASDTAIIEARAVQGTNYTPWRTFTYTQAAVAPVVPNLYSGQVRPDTRVSLVTATTGAFIEYSLDGGLTWELYDYDHECDYDYGILLDHAALLGGAVLMARATATGFLESDVLVLEFTLRVPTNGNGRIFFGQLHAHTGVSDGTGTPAEAFAEARDIAGLDFFGLSDHSDHFDWGYTDGSGSPMASPGDLWPVLNLRTYQEYGSSDWTLSRQAAVDARAHERSQPGYGGRTTPFLATTGFEFTWGGGPGHINTFNTTGWVCRRNAWLSVGGNNDQRLLNYYELLRNTPESVSMFNHPGTTFGNFNNFAHFDPQIGARIPLLEVANGSGAIGMGGYFPSYEQFTMALDRGWLLAPVNSQDNHTGNFGFANEGRVAIYTTDFSYAGMWQAFRDRAAYSTEIRDMEIVYYAHFTRGGNPVSEPMGTAISTIPNDLRFEAEITIPVATEMWFPNPDPDDSSNPVWMYRDSYTLQFAELVTNGGVRLGRQYFGDIPNGQTAFYTFTPTDPLAPGYYYLWIVSTSDRDGSQRIAVTAPIWVGRAPLVGISEVTADTFMPVVGEPVELTVHFFNDHNSQYASTIRTLEFFLGGIDGELIGAMLTPNLVIPYGETLTFVHNYIPQFPGIDNIHVRARIEVDGAWRTYTGFIDLTISANDETSARIGIDAAHFNEGIDGRFSDSFINFSRMAASMGLVTTVFRTDADIIAAANDDRYQLLLFAPPGRDGGIIDRGGSHRQYSDEVLAAVSAFANNGGTVVVTGLRNLIDGGGIIPGIAGASSHQQNRLLSALGSHIRVADAGHNAPTGWRYAPESTGHMHRLRYRHNFNLDNPFMAGIQPHPGTPGGRGQIFRVFNTGALYTVTSPTVLITTPAEDADFIARGTLPVSVNPMIFAHPNSSITDGNQDQGMSRTKFPLQGTFPRYSRDYREIDTVMTLAGNQVLMAASEEVGSNGGQVVVFASNFFSNFDVAPEIDFFGQLPTANSTIAENLLRRVEPDPVVTPIAEVRDLPQGRQSWVTIEGTVMSNPMDPPSGYSRGFSNSIYIQDDTGGINIFEVTRGMVVGQRVRAYGFVSSYQGETQLTVHLGGSIRLLDEGAINPDPPEPAELTISEALSGDYVGDLVQVQGKVTAVTWQGNAIQFTITDGDDNAIPVFIRAYITPTVDLNFVEVGAWVNVIGFSSHGELFGNVQGYRIRPRDRAEITMVLNFSGLEAAVAEAGLLDENTYSPASWAVLETALEAARVILEDERAALEAETDHAEILLIQARINNAIQAIEDAIDALVARAYEIAIDPVTHIFPQAPTGYPAQTPLTATVSNEGNMPTGALTVAVDNVNFTISETAFIGIAVDDDVTFTVVPNTGLATGMHTATITVSGVNVTSVTLTVSFLVYPAGMDPAIVDALADLVEVIFEANLLDEGDYTVGSWSAFAGVLDAAEALLAGILAETVPGTVPQLVTAIEDMTGELEDAMDDLVYIADLRDLVTEALQRVQINYTPATWTPFATALADAQGVLANPNATEGQVNAAITALEAAMTDLEERANFTALQTAVNAANALSQADYTANSWAAFIAALADAQAILANLNAEQDDVDDALEDLLAAMAALVDLRPLRTVMAEFNPDFFTAESWAAAEAEIAAALAHAKSVLTNPAATTQQVADAIQMLNDVLANLVTQPPVPPPHIPGHPGHPMPPTDDEEEPIPPFYDVPDDHWASGYVQFVRENNIMQGIGGNHFGPDDYFTRTMLVATLFRIVHGGTAEEFPYENLRLIFDDVRLSQWYAPYITWAYGNNIVEGIGGGLFGTTTVLTREQFAVMMFRLAEFLGMDTTVTQGGQWTNFADRNEISDWAVEALIWANYHGLITGTSSTTIDPSGTATRAQAAAILGRFVTRFG